MKRFVKILSGVCVAAFMALLGTACGEKQESQDVFTIGISIPAADHGWTGGAVSWAERAKSEIEKEDMKVRVLISTSKSSAEQVSAVENMLLKKIDTLVILPNEPKPLAQVCQKVKNSGAKLIVVDRQLEEPIQDLEVVGDNYNFGVEAGKLMAKELDGKGQIVILEGIPCNVNTDRVKGFMDVIKNYPEIKVLQSERTDWSTQKAQNVMDSMLQKFDRIDAVWAGDDDVLAGAMTAIEKAQRKDIKLTIGGGGSKYIIKRIMDKDPVVRLTVTYPPKMVYDAAMEAYKLHKANKSEFDQKKIVIPSVPVTADNAQEFYLPDSRY